jgi:hypothetical protein
MLFEDDLDAVDEGVTFLSWQRLGKMLHDLRVGVQLGKALLSASRHRRSNNRRVRSSGPSGIAEAYSRKLRMMRHVFLGILGPHIGETARRDGSSRYEAIPPCR